MTILRRFKGKVRDEYLELVKSFPLTSIRNQQDLKAAQEVMDRLLARGKLSSGEALYLDALSDLVAAYEDEHYRLEPATDAGMLRHLMEAKGISQIELHRQTKIAKSTISEILAGKKSFSRQTIGVFSQFFGVEKSVLARNF